MTNPQPYCCFIPCDKPAEWEIVDVRDRRPDAAFTQACEAHVGALLNEGDNRVYPLDKETTA